VPGPFATSFCGKGAVETCDASLWSPLDQAAASLEASQGTDSSAWRSDATAERIRFSPGILPDSMRWTNRPTFQQVVSFDGHR